MPVTSNGGAFNPYERQVVKAGLFSGSPVHGLGYITGAGGAVTQITSKSTGVTLNKLSGKITLNNAALASAAIVSFTVTDTSVVATDVIVACHASAGTAGSYLVQANAIAAGSFAITVQNISGGSLSEAIVINVVVFRAAIA